jgi:DNA-binding MarR family transcriptional regulator
MSRRPIEEITDKQLEILELLISSTVDNGYQPSQAELAVMTGTTRHAVSQKIKQLMLKGFLEQPQDGGGERCLKINGLVFGATLTKDWLTPSIKGVLQEIVR